MNERIQWVLNHVNRLSLNGRVSFDDMFYVVHIDEKWYYMTRLSQKYYLLRGEQEPHRTCKSKRFITKIMFMGAVARPIIPGDGEVSFDGKIGIFPFSCVVPAKRSSKNRDKGTLETRAIERITKAVIKACMIEKVIPAIKAKWPERRGRKIFIQQDNARPHISPNDPDFRAAATSDGWDMELICQPPNSPDHNILDLGLFRSIQTLQHEKAPKSVVELVNAVVRSDEEVTPVILNHTWLTLQTCMNEILKNKGNNNYKIPHMGKKRLARLNQLPTTIEPDANSMSDALRLVNQYHLSQMFG
ncbi:uncharacterized protein LOC141632159 [Silene latifolia]|uniref:uncharacterized protein LOC141632159 n=1 Tax=Silene latifolia TaxID=37657 RepID=UPI003D76A7EF